MKVWDILLFPRSMYQKITGNKATLYLGMLFVGIADIAFDMYMDKFKAFTGKSRDDIIFNAILLVLAIIVIGALDVIFFSLPLSDLFKYFKKEEGKQDGSGNLVRLMKVYIMAHLIIVPVEIFIYASLVDRTGVSTVVQVIAEIFALALPFWFSAAITRGINAIYHFQFLFKRLVFIVVFVWSYLLSNVLSFAIDKWVMILFR